MVLINSEENFINCLDTLPKKRTYKDIQCIRLFFKSIEAFANYSDEVILEFASIARYEKHARSKLYGYNDLCTSWYIVHSGCVLVEKYMFLPWKSFGHRSLRNLYRQEECIILEETELIVIDYNLDKHTQAGSMKRSAMLACSSVIEIDPIHDRKDGDSHTLVRRKTSDNSCATFDSDCIVISDNVFDPDGLLNYSANEPPGARRSHVSDSSSAISTIGTVSDHKLFSSSENLSSTSDDDSLYQDINSVPDSFYRVINKESSQRTDNDVEIMLEGIYNLSAFSNFTQKTRQELCRVMKQIYEPNANVKIIDNGYEYNTWNVIVTGSIEMRHIDGSVVSYGRGDSFGVQQNKLQSIQNGDVWTTAPSCLFFSVLQNDFYDILTRKDDTIIPETEDNGRISLVYEERNVSLSISSRVIVQGTAMRLCQCLIEDSENDPIFMENFLLTYRVFLPSPKILAEKLCQCYEKERIDSDTKVKATIRKCLVLWANNHFGDMDNPEADMNGYLEKFNDLLSKDKYSSQARSLFQRACSNNAKQRNLTFKIVRNIPFRLTGLHRGWGLFVKKIFDPSLCDLRRGDQILKIGPYSWESLQSKEHAIDIFNKTPTDSINLVVKYNPSCFQKVLDELPSIKKANHTDHTDGLDLMFNQLNQSRRNSIMQTTGKSMVCRRGSNVSIGSNSRPMSKCVPGFKQMELPQIGKIETSNGIIGKNVPKDTEHTRQLSIDRLTPFQEKIKSPINKIVNNDSDISEKSACDPQVIKVYRQNITEGKLVLLSKKTTTIEIMPAILKEFDIFETEICKYGLYLVSVEPAPNSPAIKCSRVADFTNDLAGKLSINQRYYIKYINIDSQLITTEQAKVILSETEVTLNQLTAFEIATRITYFDYALFRDIDTAEYINFIFQLPPLKRDLSPTHDLTPTDESPKLKPDGFSLGYENYEKFEKIINQESHWPATEICQEPNVTKRVEILKKFIKVANVCKCLKNFNSMMCIMIGLDMVCVSRLKSSWDRLPTKYHKMFNELMVFLKMEWNFKQIRIMELPQINVPPMIPWIALHSKDLASLNYASKTITKDGLINLEKLRKIALEIRKVTTMCSTSYSLDTILSNSKHHNSSFPHILSESTLKSDNHPEQFDVVADLTGSSNSVPKKSRSKSLDQFAFIDTLRKKKRSSTSTSQLSTKNSKKIYDEWLSTLKVRTYLLNRYVEMDSKRLHELSYVIEPQVVSLSSPGTTTSSITSSSTDSPNFKSPDLKSNSKSKLSSSTSQNSIFESPLTDRPQSIFNYQNLEVTFTLKEILSQPKDTRISRKTDDLNLVKGKSSVEELSSTSGRISESDSNLTDGITLNLLKPVSDLYLETPLSGRSYHNQSSAESLNDNYYGEIKRQANTSKQSSPRTARPQPSYSDNLNRINTHHDIQTSVQSRPIPPPRNKSSTCN